MKLLYSILLGAIVLIMPTFASAESFESISDTQYGYIIGYSSELGKYRMVVNTSEPGTFFCVAFPEDSPQKIGVCKENSHYWTMSIYDSLNGKDWDFVTKGVTTWDITKYNLIKTNTTVYAGRTTSSEVFFTVPPTPAWITSVEEVPVAMVATLVDGGLLSTGLIVLAILLGVLLVRRFPLWRLR